MSNEIVAMTATELLSRYSNGSLSPVEVTRAMLAQIQALDSEVNAYCLVDEDTTLEWARAAEQRYQNNAPLGLLDGVPVAVKDVFLTPMWPTLKGSEWGPLASVRMRVVQSVSPRRSVALSGTSRLLAKCRTGRRAPLAHWRMQAPWRGRWRTAPC